MVIKKSFLLHTNRKRNIFIYQEGMTQENNEF